MERLSSKKLEQIDTEAEYNRIREFDNTTLREFFYSKDLRIGEHPDLLKVALDELIKRDIDIRFAENE